MTIEERREYDKKWYQKNKIKAQGWKSRRRNELAIWFKELKSELECSKCRFNNIHALDFHHLSDKKYVVSDMVRHGFSRDSILNEIKKCIVLCANCHRIEHLG